MTNQQNVADNSAHVSDVIDIFVGPRLEYLTPIYKDGNEFCLIKVEVPPGVTVPIHSHEDRETFYILTGELEGLREQEWRTFKPGEVFDVKDGVKHALRNSTKETMTLLMVTTAKLGQFFRDVGRPYTNTPLSPPTEADIGRFIGVSSEYGYWMGTPDENAAVGITL